MYDITVGRNQRDRKKFGKRGTILIGKHYIKMGREQTLSNKVYMDIAGAHVVFICGKRGGGKCVSGDTIITLSNGEQKQIKDLKNWTNKEVLALNKDFKIEKSKRTKFFKRKVKKLLKIKLRSGKEIKLTPEHPLLTIEGWVNAENLKKGSRIATARKINSFGRSKFSDTKIKLLAYLIAEGHLSNGFILFSNKDNKLINEFKTVIQEFDKNLIIKKQGPCCYRIINKLKLINGSTSKRNPKGNFVKRIKFDRNNSLRKYLENLGLYSNLSESKFIPEEILKLNKKKLSIFLNRLFSCNGAIYKEGINYFKISYSSTSKKLIHQVQHLLLRYGILSKIRSKYNKKFKKSSFELEIKGNNVSEFIEKIGFYGIKENKCKFALRKIKNLNSNSNVDTIPKAIWNFYRPRSWTATGKKLNYSTPKALRESIRYSPTRNKLLKIAKADNNSEIKKIAKSDIFWDEIVDIKKLKGNFEVYDISVPNKHNFIANDIIIHNSYTMGVIAEGMADLDPDVRQNLSIILLDTMGIYWTMKYANKEDRELLDDWGLEPKSMDVQIFTPTGHYKQFKKEGIPTDYPFSIKPSELSAENWCMTLGVDSHSEVGILINEIVNKLQDEKEDYGMKEILEEIDNNEDFSKIVKGNAKNLFINTKAWGLFDDKGTSLSELVRPGQVTVLDVSCYATVPNSWNIKNLVIGLVSEKLFIQRMVARKSEEFKEIDKKMNFFASENNIKQEMPLVWLVIDEAHEFLPVKGETLATKPLVTIMREGRQPGISLILATQQPGKIHTDVMTQSDVVISHRITAKLDTDALGMLMQSYMRTGLTEALDNLPRVKGAAIIFDDTNEKMYPIRIRPRMTWHGGASPTAIHKKKEF
jgi:hypothetical protein